jgi:D-amino-acid dehydrogenase
MDTCKSSSAPIAIVGAGIVGVSIAYELRRRGKPVLLLDGNAPGMGASFGNMASIAVTEFMPSSRPSVWTRIPGWLLDPEGPVRVRPSYIPRLLPWFWRFLLASGSNKVQELEAHGSILCKRVYEDLLPMLESAGLSHMLSKEGCLSLYANQAELDGDKEHLDVINRFGFETQLLRGDEIRELESGLSAQIEYAVLFPQNRSISDPYLLVTALFERYMAMGGQFVQTKVQALNRTDAQVTHIATDMGQLIAVSQVILCAGAFTGALCKSIGDPIPLETERGYHTQIMAPGVEMRHSIIWPAKGFMVTPTAGGIRVGGTVEMAGLVAAPDYRRAKMLVKRAQQAIPSLRAEMASEWMGHRPAMPDTVPVMGPSKTTRNVFVATGHGHLGLTYAATTARLMADMVTGQPIPIDVRPYRVDRF